MMHVTDSVDEMTEIDGEQVISWQLWLCYSLS